MVVKVNISIDQSDLDLFGTYF